MIRRVANRALYQLVLHGVGFKGLFNALESGAQRDKHKRSLK